jgi:catechol 2,3-dioxygenase-like lactoylglutathione lyase family enzyme
MGLQRIGHVVLNVRDLAASQAFYVDVVGLKVTQTMAGGAFLTCGEAHHDVALVQARSGQDSPPASRPLGGRTGLNHLMLWAGSVEDVRATYRRLKAAGNETARPVDHGWVRSIYFLDPDGNTVEVGYEVPPELRVGEHIHELLTWDVEAEPEAATA